MSSRVLPRKDILTNVFQLVLTVLVLFHCSLAASAASTDFPTMKLHAERGESGAQLLVGLAYYFGEYQDGTSIEVDYEQAVYWLRMAADSGHSYAQWHLGGMYREGKGVQRDIKKAARLFLQAAKSGNVKARVNIAAAFYSGAGVEQDFDRAYAWASLAAVRGNEIAKNLVQKILPKLENRDRADSLAAEYFKKYGVKDPYE